MDQPSADDQLRALDDAELVALRLAAQVLGHKADLADRPNVGVYFRQVEGAALTELARRTTGIQTITDEPIAGLDPGADDEDRRLTAEYLGLLVANESLSPALRDVCRAFRARDTRSRSSPD